MMKHKQIVRITDAIPYQEFAREIGKSPEAVKGMIQKGKLPIIEMKEKPGSPRSENWIYLPAWNDGLKLAYESRPKEIRDGWLTWLGLGEPTA
ncbi:Cox family DNA-binding protein [Xenorhabdus bovienii]|uniref:Cox family DNA-binding protein n=1 Tax=Xenorhabdus bovienii TaxID=40576 RepID=UPI003DA6681B